MFDRFIMTNHFIEQYSNRLQVKECEIKKKVGYDLSVKMVRRIVNIGNQRYVYTRNSREFVFSYDSVKKIWVAKTVIKHSRFTLDQAINKRLREQTRFKEGTTNV